MATAEISKTELLAQLFDRKTINLLKTLLTKKDNFYLRDISRESGVSLATTFRIVQRLMGLGLVAKESKDKFIFYNLLRDTNVFNELSSLIVGATDPLQILKAELDTKFGQNSYALHTTRGKDKKLFLVSEKLNQKEIEQLIQQNQQLQNQKLSYLVLQPQQFDQMMQLGLVGKDLQKI